MSVPVKTLLFWVLCLALAVLLIPGCNGAVVENGDDSHENGFTNGEENGENDDDGKNGENGEDEAPGLQLEQYDNQRGEGHFYRVQQPPATIAGWVNNAAEHLFLGQSREYDGYLYILVTYGPKPTGGYAVNITDVVVEADRVVVDVYFTAPDEGDPVTQAFTYPYDLVLIPAVELPVEFRAGGAEEYVMTLYGADYLEPITAGSDWIKLLEPSPGDTLAGTVIPFRGVASVFEGTIQYRVLDSSGQILVEGIATAGMGEWYYFAEEVDLAGLIDAGESSAVTLELFTISPKDGSEQDHVSLQLTLSG